ncbi:prohead protease/major capsid protein fusion protein (plasmid) [Roseomonas mucosa]|uniref:prohead protease/major capsid protein fusion protein n=1 Tax=Roseomonas mucosa TaxID=207340 RepID=UPI0030CF9FAB
MSNIAKRALSGTVAARTGDLAPSTWDPATRQVDVVWTTGSVVRRRDAFGAYDEELVVSEEAVDLSRLNAGGPVVRDHVLTTQSLIGAVVPGSARIQGGQGIGRIELSDRAEVAGTIQDIASGVLRFVSAQYFVLETEVVERDGQVPLYRVVRWQPFEISFLPAPADVGAQTRSLDVPPPAARGGDAPSDTVEPDTARGEAAASPSLSHEPSETGAAAPSPTLERPMTVRPNETETETETQAAPGAEAQTEARGAATEDARTAEARGAAAENERITAIQARGLAVGAAPEVVARLVADTTMTAARAADALLDDVAERQSRSSTMSARIEIKNDEVATRAAAIEGALLHRGGRTTELTDAARQFRGLSMMELAREVLGARGVSVRGLDRNELVERALARGISEFQGMSEFSVILSNVARKSLMQGYTLAPQTWRQLVRITDLPDFKKVTKVQRGTMPGLTKVGDTAEIPLGKRTDGKAIDYKLDTYAGRVAISRQTIISDDLGAITDDAAQYGVEANVLESELVWGAILANAQRLADGKPMFHADHKNVVAGAAPSVDSFAAAEQLLLDQVDLKGRTLNLEPTFCIGGSAHKVPFQKVLGAITAGKAGDVNPFQGSMTAVIEPRLRALNGGWMIAASPARLPGVEVGYLSGAQGLQTSTREGFEVLGVELRAFLDIGVRVIEHRPFVLVGTAPVADDEEG